MRCNCCVMTDRVKGVKIDKDGKCSYCSGKKKDLWVKYYKISENKKIKLRNKLEVVYKSIKGKSSYDCILLLSGGKDSSYLLYHLVVERKLKVLAVHINVLFERPIAMKNIRRLQKKIRFDLKVIDPGKAFYRMFYKTLFLNPDKGGYYDTVCKSCTFFYIGEALKVAMDKKVPIVFVGFSPYQLTTHSFFEFGLPLISKKTWIPNIFNTSRFSKRFKSHFWDPLRYPKGTIFPRIIAPLQVMKYSEEEVIRVLSDKNILPRHNLPSLKTNCDLLYPIVYLDTKLLGYNPFVKEYSYLIRNGLARRDFWREVFRKDEIGIVLDVFKRKEIGSVGKILGLDIFKLSRKRL